MTTSVSAATQTLRPHRVLIFGGRGGPRPSTGRLLDAAPDGHPPTRDPASAMAGCLTEPWHAQRRRVEVGRGRAADRVASHARGDAFGALPGDGLQGRRGLRLRTPGDGCPPWRRLYRERLTEALVEAGIEGRVRPFHDARHTALTHLALTPEASELVLMATAGHRSFATTCQYLHLAGRAFPKAAAALEDQLFYPSEVISADPSASDPRSGSRSRRDLTTLERCSASRGGRP